MTVRDLCGAAPQIWAKSVMAAVGLLSVSHLSAAEWDITPRVSVSETYSDNIRLAPKGQEQSSFVTEISPGISVKATGARLRFNLDYTMQNLFYQGDVSDNATNHLLSATANAEIIPDEVFIDGSASISNQNVSITGPLAFDNLNDTQNRTEVKTLSLSPYWLHSFGSLGSSEVRYTYNVVDFGDSALARSTANRINIGFTSGPQFNRLQWGLRYSAENIDYAGGETQANVEDTSSQTFTANARYGLNSKLSLVGYGGYENYDYPTARNEPRGAWWRVGATWAPTSRTTFEATAGQRFFGNTYALDFKHRTRRTTWSLVYSEDVSSARTQALVAFGALPVYNLLICDPRVDPTCKPVGIIVLSSPQLVNENFITKRWEGSVALNTGKSVVTVTGFNDSRESQLNSLNDYRQYGLGGAWNYRLAPRTTSDVATLWTRSTLTNSGREDDLWYIRFGLSHQFSTKLFGSVNYRHTVRQSNQLLGDYKENAVTATLNMRF